MHSIASLLRELHLQMMQIQMINTGLDRSLLFLIFMYLYFAGLHLLGNIGRFVKV